MTMEDYDLVILGSGEGSKFLAWTHARNGNRVAVIERKYIGGSCPNVACLPSRNVIQSSKVVALARRGAEFGVRSGPVSLTHVEAAVIAHPMLVEGLVVLFSSTPTAVSSGRPS
jgi:pyruvate/2-oxoglutarate dehydrogenase complex dihydrolipoamide dehydrogenase (E3) component